MRIKVKTFATLREFMPAVADVELADGATVRSLLVELSGRYPLLAPEIFEAQGTLKPYVNILKNGRNVFFLGNLDTVLENGDTLAIFPPVAGG